MYTYTHIKTDLMDRFEACFVAIGWVIHAFICCFLSVIFIGSVHLREDYLKTMFGTVAINRNNQTLPIEFGMAVENNLYYCIWFLMRLREALRHGREVSFITDMNDVVSSCIEHVFPDSYHGYTSKIYAHKRRIWQNITTFVLNDIQLITMSDFEENICRLTPDAREILTNIGHAKWARVYFPNIRWNVVNIDVPHFFVLWVNQCNVLIIMLTESIRDYI
uniref:Uncharacterized protein n=1 Tax=Lactuca sativa TaxID=4236 RepID=A0A9R1WWH5_LACSA|nr:hypothetical protein LSAT_V11C800396290 [Lactuca sativa]